MVNKTAVRRSGYIFEYRLAFLGGSKTGKTSVLNRFVSDTFTHRYRPTVEDHTTHIIDHNGNMCVCLMVDTCGSCDFPAMRRLAITKGNAFLVFYAINDKRTFEIAKKTVTEIKSLKTCTEDVKIIVIGNKSDLENERQVKAEEGEEFVDTINKENVSALFFECSAKGQQNIDLIFNNLLDMFMPEEPTEVISERSTFTRMSLRKKAKKHRLEKQKVVESLQQQNTTCYSDTNLSRSLEHHNSSPLIDTGKLLRSSSVASGFGSSDSESGNEADANNIISQKRKEFKRQNSAKNMLKKTFGSVQKLLKPDHENIRRSSTLDNSKLESHKGAYRTNSLEPEKTIHDSPFRRASTNGKIMLWNKKQTTV